MKHIFNFFTAKYDIGQARCYNRKELAKRLFLTQRPQSSAQRTLMIDYTEVLIQDQICKTLRSLRGTLRSLRLNYEGYVGEVLYGELLVSFILYHIQLEHQEA